MSETQLNNTIEHEGLSYAQHHARRLPVVVVVRLLRTYGFYSPMQQFRIAELQGRLLTVERIGWFVYLGLLPFAVVGARALVRRRADERPQDLIALVAPLIAVTLVTMATYGNPRFRIAAEPILLVVAVMGGTVILRFLRGTANGPASEVRGLLEEAVPT